MSIWTIGAIIIGIAMLVLGIGHTVAQNRRDDKADRKNEKLAEEKSAGTNA